MSTIRTFIIGWNSEMEWALFETAAVEAQMSWNILANKSPVAHIREIGKVMELLGQGRRVMVYSIDTADADEQMLKQVLTDHFVEMIKRIKEVGVEIYSESRAETDE